jgi:uncharacterized protein YifN (PemK superfamily)
MQQHAHRDKVVALTESCGLAAMQGPWHHVSSNEFLFFIFNGIKAAIDGQFPSLNRSDIGNMPINFSPEVGQILECNFGEYTIDSTTGLPIGHPDHHLPPEMIKNRLVVVLNGKVSPTSCIVVPLSTTHDLQKTLKGWHIEIADSEIPDLVYFGTCTRWAKADTVEQVSRLRLNRPRTVRGHPSIKLGFERVGDIQRTVVKAINAVAHLGVTKPTPQKGESPA